MNLDIFEHIRENPTKQNTSTLNIIMADVAPELIFEKHHSEKQKYLEERLLKFSGLSDASVGNPKCKMCKS